MIKNPVKKSITFHFHSFRSFKVSLIKLKKNMFQEIKFIYFQTFRNSKIFTEKRFSNPDSY